MGAAGDSEGGGAGVRSRARMREKNVLCGAGRVMRLLVLDAVESVSQASRRGRARPDEELTLLLPNDGSEDDG